MFVTRDFEFQRSLTKQVTPPTSGGPADDQTRGASLRNQKTEPIVNEQQGVVRREVEIQNALGLHLRPADKFVKLAHNFQSEVRVIYNGKTFNGKSILDLTSLAAECGTRLEIEAHGADAEAALKALIGLVDARFYETADGEEVPVP